MTTLSESLVLQLIQQSEDVLVNMYDLDQHLDENGKVFEDIQDLVATINGNRDSLGLPYRINIDEGKFQLCSIASKSV